MSHSAVESTTMKTRWSEIREDPAMLEDAALSADEQGPKRRSRSPRRNSRPGKRQTVPPETHPPDKGMYIVPTG